MFLKCFKYDVRWMLAKRVWVFWLAAIGFALLMVLFHAVSSVSLFAALSSICCIASIFMIVAGFYWTLFQVWYRQVCTFYTDAAGLYRMLPASSFVRLLALFVCGMAFVFVGMCVPGLVLLLVGWMFPELGELLAAYTSMASLSSASFLSLLFLAGFCQGSFVLAAGMTGILLGFRCSRRRIAWSLLWGLGLYFGIALVLVGCIWLVSAFDPAYRVLFSADAAASFAMMGPLFGLCSGLYAGFGSVLILADGFLCRKPGDVE